MVYGANRSRSRRRVQKRIPSGKSVQEYKERRPGKPTCPTGRPLLGTARGTKNEIRKLTKSERRPSRPYGGVLSSPAMREVMLARVKDSYEAPESASALYEPGQVCVKIAGRDAGKLCVVTETIDAHFVKVDGFTRPRKVSIKHLEPTGKTVALKKGADSKAIQALLA